MPRDGHLKTLKTPQQATMCLWRVDTAKTRLFRMLKLGCPVWRSWIVGVLNTVYSKKYEVYMVKREEPKQLLPGRSVMISGLRRAGERTNCGGFKTTQRLKSQGKAVMRRARQPPERH